MDVSILKYLSYAWTIGIVLIQVLGYMIIILGFVDLIQDVEKHQKINFEVTKDFFVKMIFGVIFIYMGNFFK